MIGGKRRSWLQLYVDAMTEKDPYKRLALVRELGKTRKKAKRTEVARVANKVGAQRRKKKPKRQYA